MRLKVFSVLKLLFKNHSYIIVIAVVVACIIIKSYHNQLTVLEKEVVNLNRLSADLNTLNEKLQKQSHVIGEAVSKQYEINKKIEGNSDVLSKKLQFYLMGNDCANEFLPADVIRLQREEFSRQAP